jgi:hypothetical protein
MTNSKEKMSASYKAIFILSIFMVFFVLIAGAATNSKSSGLGMWIWGYTAWLMFKQRNADLASFYKIILWFDVIAAVVAVSVLAFSDNDVSRFIGYSLSEASILFALVISITYGLFKYFSNLSIGTNDSLKSNVNDEEILWGQVSEEIRKDERVDSLWTRAFSDADGDANKANARYMRLRFEQIKSNSRINIKNKKNSLTTNDIINTNTFLYFWNCSSSLVKFTIIAIVFLICYGSFVYFSDTFYSNNNSLKGYNYLSPTASTAVSKSENSTALGKLIYDPLNPYTQESSGSKEIGPWLNFMPNGTRFCRSNDGTIQKLYPPGAAPTANKADIECFHKSQPYPHLLSSHTQ